MLLSACAGPGRRPNGSTAALEQQKLRDLLSSPVPAALVGGRDKSVQQLAYVTDSAASVTLSLTRSHVADTTTAFIRAVHVATQHGADFSTLRCFGQQISAQATLPIPAGTGAGAPTQWTATLLLTALGDTLQARLDIPGGSALPQPTTTSRPATAVSGCPDPIRLAFPTT